MSSKDAAETAVRERMLAKIDAQIRRAGLDPDKLTLDQAWSFFCFNPDWDKDPTDAEE